MALTVISRSYTFARVDAEERAVRRSIANLPRATVSEDYGILPYLARAVSQRQQALVSQHNCGSAGHDESEAEKERKGEREGERVTTEICLASTNIAQVWKSVV